MLGISPVEDTFAKLRLEYMGTPLLEESVQADPIEQFRDWFDCAIALEIELANAVTLATATPDGVPSARVVLLKSFDKAGFVFYTSYASAKARDLEANPRAELSFWWRELARQVRISGSVTRVSASESDEYFASRPRQSNLSAMASAQSSAVSSRDELEARVEALRASTEGADLVRPDTWGGYRLAPTELEFWQGRQNRLHDRLRYRLVDGVWVVDRLAP